MCPLSWHSGLGTGVVGWVSSYLAPLVCWVVVTTTPALPCPIILLHHLSWWAIDWHLTVPQLLPSILQLETTTTTTTTKKKAEKQGEKKKKNP